GFRLATKFLGVLRHAQRVSPDRTHGLWRQAPPAPSETLQTLEPPLPLNSIQPLFLIDTRRESHRLTQRIERVDLIVNDAGDLEPERVGAQVYCGERGEVGHR